MEVKSSFVEGLRELLPQVELVDLQADGRFGGSEFDLVARVAVGELRKTLLVEVKASGQPLVLEQAIAHLKGTGLSGPDVYLVVAAPYISPRGFAICKRHGVGCVDLLGNCYLAFDNVYVERIVDGKPPRHRRMIKSLFAPVSSRLVRAMLEEPNRDWRLAELAETAGTSLGQAYNVSEKLTAEGYAEKNRSFGLRLTDPGAVLEAWREVYDVSQQNRVHSFHSSERAPSHVMTQIREAAGRLDARYALTLHAGASLVAPHVRYNDVHFYIVGEPDAWVDALGLHLVEFGGNVHLLEPYDDGVFYRARHVADAVVVGNVQLYLDLWKYPARGREQAEFLRDQEIGF